MQGVRHSVGIGRHRHHGRDVGARGDCVPVLHALLAFIAAGTRHAASTYPVLGRTAQANPHERFEAFSLFAAPTFDHKPEIFKDYIAPIFRRGPDGFSADPATFRMVPRKRIPQGVKVFATMNARAESVGEKRSFSGASKETAALPDSLRIVLQAELQERQACALEDRDGIWTATGDRGPLAHGGKNPEGPPSLAFTMITVNAAEHPLMKRFHKPGDGKRSVVIISPTANEDCCRAGILMGSLFETCSPRR